MCQGLLDGSVTVNTPEEADRFLGIRYDPTNGIKSIGVLAVTLPEPD